MFSVAHSNGRRQVLALASMNVRAVVTPFEMQYLAVPAPGRHRDRPRVATTALFQPRDERGRFVAYAAFCAATAVECSLTAAEYDEEYREECERDDRERRGGRFTD